MSWESFFTEINEELNQNSARGRTDEDILSFIDNVAREIVEDRQDEAVSDVLKKAGKAIKGAWTKVLSKLKKVASIGFRLGVAIGQLTNGKFVLFNKKGEFIVPEAEKIGYSKTTSGKRSMFFEYNLPGGGGKNMEIYMGEKLDFGYGRAYDKSGAPIVYLVDPKKPGLQEGRDYSKNELLLEAERAPTKQDIEAMQDVESMVFDSVSEPETLERLQDTAENPVKIAPVEVNYQDFKAEVKSLLSKVKEGRVLKGGKVKNLSIYAPTGWGKSHIIGDVAKDMGYHYFPLELQKVPIEVLQGFPYLSDVNEVEDMPDEAKESRLKSAKKVVKMAPSEFLPPAGDPGNWLLFLDEFNRADTEKMSAVMNLLLTGELGGASSLVKEGDDKDKLERYKLPKKVVVILAMNTAEQEGIEDALNAVKDLDIATLERVHRVLIGKYDAPSWIQSFAGKAYKAETESGETYWTKSRVPPIILNYIINKMKTKGGGVDPEKPFLLPISVAGEKGGGGQRTTSPRSWTMIADNMIENGMEVFSNLSNDIKNQYRDRAKKIMKDIQAKWEKQGGGDPGDSPPDDPDAYLFAAWMEDASNQVFLLSKEAPELGDKGQDYIRQMINDYKKKAQEGISEIRILLDYGNVQSIVKKNFTNLGFGTHSQFLERLYNQLATFKDEKSLKEYMDANGFKIVSQKGPVSQIYSTFKALAKDLDLAASDLATFAHLIEDGKDDNELVKQLFKKFNGQTKEGKLNWPVFREALKKKTTTKSKLEKETEGEEEANESLIELFSKLKGM